MHLYAHNGCIGLSSALKEAGKRNSEIIDSSRADRNLISSGLDWNKERFHTSTLKDTLERCLENC